MSDIWIIYRNVPGKPDTLQVLKNGDCWAMAYVGESVDKNGHLEVRLFYTEKERVLGLRQAGATYKGANTPQHMTLEEFVLKTTPPKKDGTEKN